MKIVTRGKDYAYFSVIFAIFLLFSVYFRDWREAYNNLLTISILLACAYVMTRLEYRSSRKKILKIGETRGKDVTEKPKTLGS